MSLINSVYQYINTGDLSLDPTKQKKNKLAKIKRTVNVVTAGSLGILLSPASIVLGPALGLYYYGVSIVEYVESYFNNKDQTLIYFIIKFVFSTIIETPIFIVASTIALFLDIATTFLRELICDEITFLNLQYVIDKLETIFTGSHNNS